MKKAIKFSALMLVLVIVVGALASCSTFGSIKSNFESNNYELKSSETQEIDVKDGKVTITVHTFQLKSEGGFLDSLVGLASTAVVWEFGSDADMAKAIEDNATLSGIIEDAQDSDYVNGNCVLTTLNPDAVKIFNGESID